MPFQNLIIRHAASSMPASMQARSSPKIEVRPGSKSAVHASSARPDVPGRAIEHPGERGSRRSEFDHGAARQRDVVGHDCGAATAQMIRGILFAIDVLARRAVNRNDHLVAALRRA
jgi:hypothetical protein